MGFLSFLKKEYSLEGSKFLLFIGLPGAGKTLSAVEEVVIPAYLSQIKIYSNTWINLQSINYIYDPEDFCKLRNCLLVIDEIGQIVDPYAWKDLSWAVRSFFQNHRRYNVSIVATTQDISFIAKPARVLVSEFIFCENVSDKGLFSQFSSTVSIKQKTLTFNDLKKLQAGIGSKTLKENEDEEMADMFSEDIDDLLESTEMEIDVRDVNYSKKDLAHKELDPYKLEFYHYFCPQCYSRQYQDIPRGTEFKHIYYNKKNKPKLKINTFCPAHPLQRLELRVSSAYDSEYLVQFPQKDIVWKPYKLSPEGYRLIPAKTTSLPPK